KLEYAIEQHPSFLKVISEAELAAYEADHQKRRYSYKGD
ncbi:MAG: 1-acyl-sn-glycerol-3-phosphate acyltransferase, partial [Bacteroidota bacterium]